MFDTTCADRRNFAVPFDEIDKCPRVSKPRNIGIASWQEHCVECGQPECFGSCSKYQRSFDGKCRRFVSGIVPVCASGRLYFGCEFKQWGKLEAVFTGRMWSKRCERYFGWIDRQISALIIQIICNAILCISSRPI